MNDDFRPNPDEILKTIKIEEENFRRGKLRVFLGMCAGAGKTYAMLKAAHQAKAEGVDIVVGYVETHGRRETVQLTEDLEIIPRFQRIYRDVLLEEMNLDAILERNPKVVLVDELAHSNIPESRHIKRYQDVQELLRQGIDVYTTLNVQHLESRTETVTEVTGVKIHETVPDSLLQSAEIELIDITPDELLKRMSEGKVYVPEKAHAATMNFFRKGNLHALREIALRFTAERVDIDMLDYMRAKNIFATWKTTEKLMVAVGPSPSSQKLIRWTRRMAFNLGAQWIAVSIDLGNTLSKKAQDNLLRNQNMAKELGAKIIHVVDNDVVSGLLKVAIQYNVTQIVIGKTNEHPLHNYLNGGSIVDRLLKNSENIDIYVVKADKSTHRHTSFWKIPERKSKYKEYINAALTILLIAGISFPLRNIIGYQSVGLFFLLGIASLSLTVGRFPIFIAALLSSLIWNFFFIPPIFTFHINNIHDIIALLANFFIAMTGGSLINRIRKSQSVLQKSQDNLSVLFSILEALNNASSIKEVVNMTRKELNKHFDADGIIYLKEKGNAKLDNRFFGNGTFFNDKEFSVANWTYENKKQAGHFTNTLPYAELQYFPLISREGIIGVLGIRFDHNSKLPQEKIILLRSFISQITSSLQREINIDENKRKQIYTESQKLFQTVLNSVSHELRTPISVITTAVSNMNDKNTASKPESIKQIGEELNSAAMRLNVLVENILDMSRIESGYLSLNLQMYEAGDLLGIVLNELEKEKVPQPINLHIEDNLPMIKIDINWFKQAIINILHNAVSYTPPTSRIDIQVKMNDQHQMEMEIADNGSGVPVDALDKLFEKFYRVPGSKSGGTGLGLTITKAIIDAHNGTITATNKPEGGLLFKITLDTEQDHGQQ
ncbi:MAG: sensor histidine kinase KdpD [Bacteroidales bacterium]|nr:sensor histidine kinase KdpD [Bacteroidales bacterium]